VTPEDWSAVAVTVRLASATTAILLLLGTPLAWWLARSRSRVQPVVEAVVALPLVLPPTVLGFYLLLALGPNGPIGRLTELLGIGGLPFSFAGLLAGSVVYSLPFVVQPLRAAFRAIGAGPLEAAATLRAGPWDRFVHVAAPLAAPAFLSAAVIGFAHTVGEFGVVLLIGGNIPGSTRVLSVAVYDHVEALAYPQAHALAGGLLAFSFAVLWAVYVVERRGRART